MALEDYLATEIAHDFADGFLSRREALRRLGLLGMAAGAAALLAACGGDDDDDGSSTASDDDGGASAAAGTNSEAEDGDAETAAGPTDVPSAEEIRFTGPNGQLIGAFASPAEPAAAVLVIHENRGLTPHFFEVVTRLADSGYAALCVDLLSAEGGTVFLNDEGAAQAALGQTALDVLLGDLRAGLDELERRAPDVKLGAVGFCFGGGMVWNLLNAGEARLAAAVPFYGPAPADADFGDAEAAVLAIYGENDNFVNGTREPARAALEAAGLEHEVRTFAGAGHAFFNDTGARYNPAAATDAYAALLDWFEEHLA